MTRQGWILKALLPLGLLGLAACAPEPSFRERVNLSVDANQQAVNEVDWKTSPQHPTKIFADLRARSEKAPEDKKTQKEICDALKQVKDDRSLFIFEAELRAAPNKDVLGQCRDYLLRKLEVIHARNRAEMKSKGFATLNYGRLKNVLNLDLQNPDSWEEIKKNVQSEINGSKVPTLKTEEQLRDVSKGYVAIRGDVKPGQVILTFDDGPHPLMTPLVAAALRSAETHAMFFQLGSAASRSPWVTQQLAGEGHVIANHSFGHPYMGALDDCHSDSCREEWVDESEAIFQLQKTQKILFDLVGAVEPFVRFPYGAKTKGLGEFLKANGLGEFFWSTDSEDWRFSHTNEQVLDKIMKSLDAEKRGIILMHDIHRRTAEIVPELLNRLAKGGYSIVLLRSSDVMSRSQHPLIQGEGLVMPTSLLKKPLP